jgi:hypothetical protein
MTVALRRAMTVDEYLAWSESQSERRRTELINGQIVTMAAERLAHNRIKGAVQGNRIWTKIAIFETKVEDLFRIGFGFVPVPIPSSRPQTGQMR